MDVITFIMLVGISVFSLFLAVISAYALVVLTIEEFCNGETELV